MLVDASSSTQAGFGDYLVGAFDGVPGVDERKVTVPWYEDGASVDKNKDLLTRYAAVPADISAAATTCANAIQGLLTRTCMPPAVAGLSSLVGYDINAADGWHAWREDGVAAGTEAVLNIGTLFIPGAGEASGALKGASLAAKASRIAELGADVLVQGGSWAVRGGIRLTDTLLDALRFGDRALPLADDLATTTTKTVTLKPAALIDLLDEPHTTGSRHTPADDQLGPGPAQADTATAPSADHAPAAHAPDSAQSPPHDASSHPPVDDHTAAHHPDGDPGTHAPLDPSHSVDSSADWTGESGLHLDGEQVKVVDDYHAAAARAEPAITKALQQVEAQTNADLATTRTSTHPGTVKLVGLDARLKTPESLYRKIATDLFDQSGDTVESVLHDTADVVRYTYSVPGRGFGTGVQTVIDHLETSGFTLVKWKNSCGIPDVYQGVKSQWSTPPRTAVRGSISHSRELSSQDGLSRP